MNFHPLCFWFNHLLLTFLFLPMVPLPLASTHTALTYGPNYIFPSLQDWNHLTCPSACQGPATRMNHLLGTKTTPEHASLYCRDGRVKQTQQLPPCANCKTKSGGKLCLYPLPQQIQSAWERHLALFPPPFMVIFFLIWKISFGRFATKIKYYKNQKLLENYFFQVILIVLLLFLWLRGANRAITSIGMS